MKTDVFAGLIVAGFVMAMFLTPSAFAAGGSLKNGNSVSSFTNVSMEVGRFAAITNFDDFVLTTSDADGSAGAVYSGSSTFRLVTNSAVHVVLEGFNLYNGKGWVSTTWALDETNCPFIPVPVCTTDTGAGVHNVEHTVSASVTLDEISAQEADTYSAQIILTVAAL